MSNPKMRGGLVQRGSTWSYIVRVADPETGQTRPKWVGGFRTRQEAKVARAEALTKIATGNYVEPRKLTVREYLQEWLATQETQLKPSTHDGYRRTAERYITPYIGGVRLQQLNAARLNSLTANSSPVVAGMTTPCPSAPSGTPTRSCGSRSQTPSDSSSWR